MSIQGSSQKHGWFCLHVSLFMASTLIASLLIDTPVLFSQGVPVKKTSQSSDRTRGFIDDYSSSLDNDFYVPHPQGHQTPGDTGTVEGKTLRPLIRAFSDNLTQLTYALNEQMSQVPGFSRLRAWLVIWIIFKKTWPQNSVMDRTLRSIVDPSVAFVRSF